MNGFNNNINGWHTCNNHNNINNSLSLQYCTTIDQQIKAAQQNAHLESIRSNLSNLQNHLMNQGNNNENNHVHHSGYVNHIHCNDCMCSKSLKVIKIIF